MPENAIIQKTKKWWRSPHPGGNRTHLIFTLATFLITLAILGFLIYREREILLSYQWQIRLWPAIVSFFSFSLALFLAAVLWGWILNTLGSQLDYRKHIQYYCISNVAKRIPGTLWYIASRAQFYKEENIDIKLTSLASGVEMALITLSGILASSLFAIPIILSYNVSPWSLAVIFLMGCFLIHPRIMARIFRLFKVEATMFNYRDIILWLLSYGLLWIIGGIVLFSIGNAITPITFQNLGYVIGSWALVGILSTLLFFSPSNLGVTEIGLSLLLGQIMPFSVGVIIAILARLLIIFYEIMWAFFFLGYRSLFKPD